jgi:PAS domain S-box-containing protein
MNPKSVAQKTSQARRRPRKSAADQPTRFGHPTPVKDETYRAMFEATSDAIFIEALDGHILDCNHSACNLFGYSKDELLGLSVIDLVPEEVARILPEVIKTELSQGGFYIETLNKRKNGQVFPCEVSTMLTTIGGETRIVAYVRDITQRKITEDALHKAYDELEQRVAERTQALEIAVEELEQGIKKRKRAEAALKQRAAQLGLLNEIGGRIAAIMELDSVFERTAHLVQESFNYHHVALFTLDRALGQLVMKAKAGSFAELFPPGHKLSLNQGMVGWVGEHGKKLLSNDVRAEPRYVNLYPNIVPTLSELSVPIQVGKEVVGVLDVQSPDLNAFDLNDVLVMETLADQIAVAIENARLYEAVQRELTERRRAEEALRESEKRYRTLVQTSPDAILYIALDTRIILCNQQAARLFGYDTPDQMIGLRTLKLFPPDSHADVLAQYRPQPAGWNLRNQERMMLKRDSTLFPVEISASLVANEAGDPVGIIAVVRDITERKRLERFMLRTERLAAMGNIAANLAHEIKNPLQTVQSNVELVLDFALDPEERDEHLRLCYQEIERLVELTNRLLNLASPRKVAYRTTSAADLIQRAMILVEKPLKNAHVEAAIEVPEDLPPISVAPDQIIEVLLNLILNAIDAMPEGGHVHVAAHQQGDEMQLHITNSGPHIPSDHIEQIFDPFFTTKPEGTGLGLYISQSVIQQLGGTLTVENLAGDSGVIFSITLPINNHPNGLEKMP